MKVPWIWMPSAAAVLGEAARDVGAQALPDVVQDLVVARLVAHSSRRRPFSFMIFSVLYGTLALALQE